MSCYSSMLIAYFLDRRLCVYLISYFYMGIILSIHISFFCMDLILSSPYHASVRILYFHPYIMLLYGSYAFVPIPFLCMDSHFALRSTVSIPISALCFCKFQQATALDITDSWANRYAASACVNPSLGHMFHVKHIRDIDSIVYTFSISPWVGFSMVSRLFSDMFLAFFSFCES